MRLARVFCFLVILGSSAVAAYADSDPIVLTNYKTDPFTCTPDSTTICIMSGDTATVTDYTSQTFPLTIVNVTGATLYNLVLVFDDVPDETSFECYTDIFADCTEGIHIVGPTEYDATFTMGGAGPPCTAGGYPTCPGDLPNDFSASTTLQPDITEVPEPGTTILFATGLILIFLGMKLRSHART